MTYILVTFAVHPCAEGVSPCLNGGHCFSTDDVTAICSCVNGFTGTHCETGKRTNDFLRFIFLELVTILCLNLNY